MGASENARLRAPVGLALWAVCWCGPALATVRFVDADASGAANGASWTDAYPELRDAIAAAAGNPAITEIWVAAGVYTPTAGVDPLATFQLRSGLVIHGGFAGYENSPIERDPGGSPAILSGDIGILGNSADNVFHVVTGSGANATALLEGVIISDGNARASALRRYGGGVLIEGAASAPRLINCTIRDNGAYQFGGGLYTDLAVPVLVNCVFRDNATAGDGGGAYSARGAARFVHCTFIGNTAAGAGGGVFTRTHEGAACPDNAAFLNCVLWDNSDAAPLDQADQFAAPLNFCPPEFNRAAPTPLLLRHSVIQAWDGVLGGSTNTGEDPVWIDADGRLGAGSAAIDLGDPPALPPDDFDLDDDADTAELLPVDRDGRARIVGAAPDAGAFEFAFDCNSNGVLDDVDIAAGTSLDCDGNAIPDECDPPTDCNTNGIPDRLDLAAGTSSDCDADCLPDECTLAGADCNANGVLDACDLAGGSSADCNGNLAPDECEPDCNSNSRPDDCDIAAASSTDCNTNAVPDECEDPAGDCNANLLPDECELLAGTAFDCDDNGRLDGCDIAAGTTLDCDGDSVPDDCVLTQRFFLLDNGDVGVSSIIRRFDPDNAGVGAPVVATLPAAGNDRGFTAYGGAGKVLSCDLANARILEVDVFHHVVRRTIGLDRPLIEIAYDWTTDQTYGTAADGGLYRVDLVSGMTTFVSSLPGSSPTNWVCLAYDDRTRMLLGASQTERWVFQIEPSTGMGIPLPHPLGVGLGDLALDFIDGTIYGIGTDGGLYRVARHTGVAELVFTIPAVTGTPAGLAILLASDCTGNGVLDRCDIAAGSADCNHNALPDECDPDCNGSGLPDACEPSGPLDWNGDGLHTVVDILGLPACLGGPDAAPSPSADACLPACLLVYDLDADGDVDLADFAAVQTTLGTP